MATLVSWKANGKNSRNKEEFKRPMGGVSRGNYKGPTIGMQFPTHYNSENDKDRNYSLTLNEEEVESILKTLLGDASQGPVTDLLNDTRRTNMFEPVLNKIGIYFDTYRIPAPVKFSAFDTHYYVRAINHMHAAKQLSSIFKNRDLNPDLIELVPAEIPEEIQQRAE